MIEIFISSSSPQTGLVWNVQDAFALRKDHRIVGSLSGCLPRAPRQDNFLGVPLILTQEEIDLLVSESLARTVSLPILSKVPSAEVLELFNKYREDSYNGQVEIYRELRKREIVRMADQIVEGKRRKMRSSDESKKKGCDEQSERVNPSSEDESKDGKELSGGRETNSSNPEEERQGEQESREDILEREFEKIRDIPRHQEIFQTFNAHPWLQEEDKVAYDWVPEPSIQAQTRRKAFRMLWNRGFYITSGEKFGGDFLVYPGDPCMFHARYVVVCSTKEELLSWSERDLVCRSRLGTAVKKTVLLAFLNSDQQVEFKALNRITKKRDKF